MSAYKFLDFFLSAKKDRIFGYGSKAILLRLVFKFKSL